jgi:hypothetical protein
LKRQCVCEPVKPEKMQFNLKRKTIQITSQ